MRKYIVWIAFCHTSIVLSMVFLVLFLIDRINPAVGFPGRDQGDWLLLALCVCALGNGIFSAVSLVKREKHVRRREKEARRDGER